MEEQKPSFLLLAVLMILSCTIGVAIGGIGAWLLMQPRDEAMVSELPATYTPYPTYTPYTQPSPYPTYTSFPSPEPEATAVAVELLPTSTAQPGGVGSVIVVDSWRFEITGIRVDPGLDASRKVVVLLGNLTNEGMAEDTFTAGYRIVLQDAEGRQYEADFLNTLAAQDRYGTESAGGMNPGATRFTAMGYDVAATENQFTIVPGSLVTSWSGDISFTLP